MKGVLLLVALLLLTTIADARRGRRRERSSSDDEDGGSGMMGRESSRSTSRSTDNEDRLQNCTEGLNDAIENGAELFYCQTSRRQCCSNPFLLDRRVKLRRDLLESLTDDLAVNGETLDNIIAGLAEFLRNTFINRFLEKLNTTFINEPGFVESFAQEFQFIIEQENDFDVSDYVQRLVNRVVTAIIDSFVIPRVGEITEEQRDCIIRNLLTPGVQDDIVANLTLLRRAFSTLLLIDEFYDQLARNVTAIGYRLSDRCIDTFVNLRCEGCRRVIPRSCRNTCSAIVRGCYAALADRLMSEFNLLWDVVDRLTDTIRSAAQTDPTRLIAADAGLPDLITQVVDVCGPTNTNDNRRSLHQHLHLRQDDGSNDDSDNDSDDNDNDSDDDGNDDESDGTNDSDDDGDDSDDDESDGTDDDRESSSSRSRSGDVPDEIVSNSSALRGRGILEYGEAGPRFCRSNNNRNCWNGAEEVSIDMIDFDGITIEDQINNPVFQFTEEDIAEAQQQADALGFPVTEFLMSSRVRSVAPETVDDLLVDDNETGGASSKVASLLVILLATAIVALFIN